MVYKYRNGHGFKGVDAQTVGETVSAMMEAAGGRLAPADVVEESRPEDAPLHPCFTWDDAEAAEKYREDEARRVIRSYVVVRTDDRGQEVEEVANVSVASPYDDEGPAYVPTRTAMEDPELRARVIALAEASLAGWQARFGHLRELAAAAELVQQAREAAARNAAAATKRKPARAGRRPAAMPAMA